MLIDTHCHIHESGYPDPEGAYVRALENDVSAMILVGTDEKSSHEAVEFAAAHEATYAAVGVHPHEAKHGWEQLLPLIAGMPKIEASETATTKMRGPGLLNDEKMRRPGPRIVAIGEIGLDYFYTHSPRDVQLAAFEAQLQMAVDNGLPVIFHVRDASAPENGSSVWDDFWSVLDNFPDVRGVLHSFTDTTATLDAALGRGLYVGVNGISTFARDKQAMFGRIPLERMVLETDAPFLTPVPFRGTVNEPAFVRNVAEFQASSRGIDLEEIATATTANARELFAI